MVNPTTILSPDIIIRPCTTDDAALLSLIGGATFLETFYDIIGASDMLLHVAGQHSEAYYAKALAKGYGFWMAVDAKTDTPVGYQMLSPPNLPIETSDTDIELKRIYLFARHHGRGLAVQFEKIACDYALSMGCKRLLLGVYSGNNHGIAFYEKCGFKIISDRVFTVGNSDYKDWIMAKNLV